MATKLIFRSRKWAGHPRIPYAPIRSFSHRPMPTETVHILGVGNLGKFVAHSLAKDVACPVTLLFHREGLKEQWESEGSRITCITGGIAETTTDFGIEVLPSDTPSKQPEPNQRMIKNLVVTTKAYNIVSALSRIHHRLDPSSTILLLHNGMGTPLPPSQPPLPNPRRNNLRPQHHPLPHPLFPPRPLDRHHRHRHPRLPPLHHHPRRPRPPPPRPRRPDHQTTPPSHPIPHPPPDPRRHRPLRPRHPPRPAPKTRRQRRHQPPHGPLKVQEPGSSRGRDTPPAGGKVDRRGDWTCCEGVAWGAAGRGRRVLGREVVGAGAGGGEGDGGEYEFDVAGCDGREEDGGGVD